MTNIHTANLRRKRAAKKALGFTIGRGRWKGKFRRVMHKLQKEIKRNRGRASEVHQQSGG